MQTSNGVVFHDFAEQFPIMPDVELSRLAASIKETGLQVPLIRRKSDGVVLDGRNRYRACQEAGVEPRFEERDLNEEQSLDLIAALNVERRHLNESQRAVLAADYVERLQKHREKPGVELFANVQIITEAPGRPDHGVRDDVKKAADQFNISERSIDKARKVKKEAKPKVVKEIQAGKKSVSAAAKDIKKAKAESIEKAATDLHGVPIPEYLTKYFDELQKFRELDALLVKAAGLIHDLATGPAGRRMQKWLQQTGPRWKSTELNAVKGNARDYRPYTICPYCETATAGRANKQCQKCDGEGWIDEPRWKNSPADYRANVDRLKVKK